MSVPRLQTHSAAARARHVGKLARLTGASPSLGAFPEVVLPVRNSLKPLPISLLHIGNQPRAAFWFLVSGWQPETIPEPLNLIYQQSDQLVRKSIRQRLPMSCPFLAQPELCRHAAMQCGFL
jgi:hypothetical protein